MTLEIRDRIPSHIVLVPFDAIADCLEPEALKCLWRVSYVDGMLISRNDSYTIDDAYAEAAESRTSPMSWQELRRWSSQFFQIYNCQFQSLATRGHEGLQICCIDSSQWEITTRNEVLIERLRRRFKIVSEVEGH